jgi:hypothetical protein
MYGPPRRCKDQARSDDQVCINVSGLSRVGRCCGQAMMRSARPVLTGYKPEPGGHVAPLAELHSLAGCREKSCGRKRADARDCHQTPCGVVRGRNVLNFTRHLGNAGLEPPDILEQACQQTPHRWRQVVALVRHHGREIGLEPTSTLMHRDPVLEAEGPHLTDYAGPLRDKTITNPVDGLEVDLLR